jgi:hypothetical protein
VQHPASSWQSNHHVWPAVTARPTQRRAGMLGRAPVTEVARSEGFGSLGAAWCHRQSTLARTGMSRRVTFLLTLCNSPLPGAAQVAAFVLRERRLDAGRNKGRPDLGILSAQGRWDRIAKPASWGWPDGAEAVRPQMHAGCDVGLDLDGFKLPVIGRSRGCQFQLRAWRPERVAKSGRPRHGCAVWRGHGVRLRSFTVSPPSWTSKMKWGAGSSWQ